MRKVLSKLAAAAMVMSALFAGAAYADETVTVVAVAPEAETAAETAAVKTGWEMVGNKWFYWLEDGTCAKNTWIVDDAALTRYWMREDGSMATSQWVGDNGTWYYVGDNGAVLKNQLLVLNNGYNSYWLDENGVMAANQWVEVPKENGGSDWYYFQADGSTMSRGWHNIDGDDYYFLKGGKIAVDAVVSGGRVGSDGRRVK